MTFALLLSIFVNKLFVENYMYAVAEIAGKQYIVEEGKTVDVDRLGLDAGASVDIDTVCLVKSDAGDVTVGAPYVTGASVKATVKEEIKGKKLAVFFYRKRKDSKRMKGHRARYSRLLIEKIQQA